MTQPHSNATEHHAHGKARALRSVLSDVRLAVASGRPADVTLSSLFRKSRKYGSRDRRFLGDAIFSYFRWYGWLHESCGRNDDLACALAWWLDQEAMPDGMRCMAIDAGLDPDSLPSLAGLSLEDRAHQLGRLLGISPPSIEQLVPDWVDEMLYRPRDDSRISPFVESLQRRPPTWLRVPGGREDEFLEAWRPHDPDAARHPAIPGAVRLTRAISRDAVHGRATIPFEIQDLASQCVVWACQPQPGESWWDACAGAGGKALHLLEFMRRQGRVRATDVRKRALDETMRRSRRLGMTGIDAAELDVEAQAIPDGLFDGVLVDAPCSGLGTWSRNPDARWRCNASEIDEFSERQYRIMHRAAGSVRPGGTLVYAACTLTHAEGTGLIRRFIRDHPPFRSDDFVDPLAGSSEAGCVYIWPWMGPCDGMFIARLKRE